MKFLVVTPLSIYHIILIYSMTQYNHNNMHHITMLRFFPCNWIQIIILVSLLISYLTPLPWFFPSPPPPLNIPEGGEWVGNEKFRPAQNTQFQIKRIPLCPASLWNHKIRTIISWTHPVSTDSFVNIDWSWPQPSSLNLQGGIGCQLFLLSLSTAGLMGNLFSPLLSPYPLTL